MVYLFSTLKQTKYLAKKPKKRNKQKTEQTNLFFGQKNKKKIEIRQTKYRK